MKEFQMSIHTAFGNRVRLSAWLVCAHLLSACQGEPSEATSSIGGAGGKDDPMGDESGGGGGTAGASDSSQGGSGGEVVLDAGHAAGGSAGMGGKAMVEMPPIGSVPIFVAVGRGGRRISSCDLGRTWVADQQEAPESQDNMHRTYTPKGLAYGNGTFVFFSGWGTNTTAWLSQNAIDWSENQLTTPYGGVGVDDGTFVAVGNRNIATSKDNGATWPRLGGVSHSIHDRETAAFTGIWASGADTVALIRRGSGTWTALTGCVGKRHTGIGEKGGFVAGLGIMLSVGDDGDTCGVNIASGAPLAAGKLGARVIGKPAFVGDAIWVVTGDTIRSTTDGVNWSSRPLPAGIRFDLVARSSSGTYVGVAENGDSFFYSDDGVDWKTGSGPKGNALSRLVFGHGTPSGQCPKLSM